MAKKKINAEEEIVCDFCSTPTGRHKDGQTDSIVCNQCGHRVR